MRPRGLAFCRSAVSGKQPGISGVGYSSHKSLSLCVPTRGYIHGHGEVRDHGSHDMDDNRFAVGMKVYFGRDNGEKTLGEIVKINRQTVKVRQLEERGSRGAGVVWNVSKTLITSAETGEKIAPRRTDFLMSAEETILNEIRRIYNGLRCDGEATREEAMRTKRRLEAELLVCFNKIGRVVREEEVF